MSIVRHVTKLQFPRTTALLFLSFGCKDLGTDPDPGTNFTLTVSSSHTHTSLASPGHEALVITSAKVLLRDIQFKEANSEDSCDVESGPFVLPATLDGSMVGLVSTRIRPGAYSQLRCTLHKQEDDEPLSDPEFREKGNGGLAYSVIIKGYYHETPFDYKSRINARQELELLHPLVVPSQGIANVTLKVDPYAWLTVGNLVLDPFTQGNEIDERIKLSFADAFEDNDRNGEPD